jgi:hypothetical protein
MQAIGAFVGLQGVLKEEFGNPVGIDRLAGTSSPIGIFDGTLKTAQLDENTKLRTPDSIVAFRSVSAASTLLRKYLRGFCTDSPT